MRELAIVWLHLMPFLKRPWVLGGVCRELHDLYLGSVERLRLKRWIDCRKYGKLKEVVCQKSKKVEELELVQGSLERVVLHGAFNVVRVLMNLRVLELRGCANLYDDGLRGLVGQPLERVLLQGSPLSGWGLEGLVGAPLRVLGLVWCFNLEDGWLDCVRDCPVKMLAVCGCVSLTCVPNFSEVRVLDMRNCHFGVPDWPKLELVDWNGEIDDVNDDMMVISRPFKLPYKFPQ